MAAVRALFERAKGPRGRAAKRCAIELDGACGRLHAEVCDTDVYVAVDRAAKAIGYALRA